jgi:hypothetical protein
MAWTGKFYIFTFIFTETIQHTRHKYQLFNAVYQWCSTRGLRGSCGPLNLCLRPTRCFRTCLTCAPRSESRTTFYGNYVNFTRLVKSGGQYLSCNRICAYYMGKHCMLETLKWEEWKKIWSGKLHHPRYFIKSKYIIIIIDASVLQS